MNVGVITVIWSTTPLMIAIGEFLVFGQRLKTHYIIGMLLMVACASILSLNSIIFREGTVVGDIATAQGGTTKKQGIKVLPSWIAVLFAVITPVSFTARVITFRKLTGPTHGLNFSVLTLMMSSFFVPNLFVMAGAIYYWTTISPIDWHTFLLGTVGSVIDSMAMNLIYVALSLGPGGPTTAIVSMCSVLITLLETFRQHKMPSPIELAGLAIGIVGALEFVVPKLVHLVFCCGFTPKRERTVGRPGGDEGLLKSVDRASKRMSSPRTCMSE